MCWCSYSQLRLSSLTDIACRSSLLLTHSASSSVPSRLFQILVFSKLWMIIMLGIALHPSRIHQQSMSMDGLLILPAGVRSWFPSAIHLVYSHCMLSVKGLLIDTSRGCSRHQATRDHVDVCVHLFCSAPDTLHLAAETVDDDQ